jgi:predicted nucleic acid-binding protein
VQRIFVDTNVLFPFSVMDLLLGLSEDGVHTVLWSNALLDEWERVIVREHQRTPETAASVTAAIRTFFADDKVELATYEHLIEQMPGNDPDDHHHMAAAIAGRASVLVTENLKDFPAQPLAERGLRVVRPDDYLCEVLDQVPDEIIDTVLRIAAEKRNPPRTVADILDALSAAGAPRFAAHAHGRLGTSCSGLSDEP